MSKLFIVTLLLIIAVSLVLTVAEMPLFGAGQVPARKGPAEHYLKQGKSETKALNIMSAILVDYRAYDTLMETTVLFTATAAVLALAHEHKKKGDD